MTTTEAARRRGRRAPLIEQNRGDDASWNRDARGGVCV